MSDYTHRSHDADAGAPLLFLFHGTGGDENQFFSLGRELLPTAGLVSPRGDVSEMGAARFFRRTGEGRYDMADLARAVEKMRAFVKAEIAVRKPSRVIGLGYSNGANILAATAMAEPGLFHAAVLMHPLIPYALDDADASLAGTNILVTAGRADPICPAEVTERLAAHLLARGANVRAEWHPGGHELRQNEVDAAAGFLTPATERVTA